MRESDVVGIKDALECRKNQPIILREIRERMEQFQYCSPNGGRFTVIRLMSAAWSVFHVSLLPAFLSRCMLDASVERKVSRALHRAGIKRAKTREALSRELPRWSGMGTGLSHPFA